MLAFFVLLGIYKGFLSTILSIGAFIMSWLVAMVFLSVGSNLVKDNDQLFNMMLYYTEGSEYVGDVELAKTPISEITSEQLAGITGDSDLPYPMGRQISENVAKEAFAPEGATTLGEYFNQTIVCVFINTLVFLVLYIMTRVIIAFVINGVDYAWSLPVLRQGEKVLSGGVGLIRGILAMFLLFMLVPLGLVVLGGKVQFINDLVNDSVFAAFFYRSNFLLSMMPGT